MKIIRAQHLGMCFGVRDAIQLAKQTAASQSLTVLGQLVHNQSVLDDLQQRGIQFAEEPASVRTSAMMITAHGASDRKIKAAEATGKRVLQATCPLVDYAHRNLKMLLAGGYHPVVIGKRGHVEVNGLTEDLQECDIVLSEDEINRMQPQSRFGVVAQTTQPIGYVQHLVDCIRRRFPKSEVMFLDTVCKPTKDRQTAAEELAGQSDVVVVIGGANSNNTHQLVRTCERFCNRVHSVQSANDLCREWFFDGDTVGITAGTSTPDHLIQEVEDRLRQWSKRFTNSFDQRTGNERADQFQMV